MLLSSLIWQKAKRFDWSSLDAALLLTEYFLGGLRLKEEIVGKYELIRRHPFAFTIPLHQNSLN